MKKNIIFLISLIIILSLSNVNAYLLYCLTDGESLPPSCSGNDCRYTCDLRSGSGFCQICTTDNGYPGVNPSNCNNLACNFLGGDNVDTEPPVLTLLNPVNDETYGSKRVNINMQISDESRIEYMDNINGGGWRTVTSNFVTTYNRQRTFNEGINDITFRATKDNGLNDEERVVFYVDSKKPDIRKVLPEGGFLDGTFEVGYTELNLKKVEFYYKGEDESNWNKVDVQGCVSGEKTSCSLDVDLSSYDGENVNYKFIIYDSANSDESNVITGRVDSEKPVLTLNEPSESGFNENQVLFDLESSKEVNFYYVNNNDESGKRRSLCKETSQCNKLMNFKEGIHDITIYAEDRAGNFDSEEVMFFVDTKRPNIKKVIPNKGDWVNNEGLVSVQYDEVMLDSVSLFYGMDNNYQEVILNGCPNGKKQTCSVQVDFSDHNEHEIDAYFVVRDNYNAVSSKVLSWNVDTEVPEFVPGFDISSIEVENGEVIFNLKSTEKVNFEYKSANSENYKNLCRNKDTCQRTIKFKPGSYTIDLRLVDQAGNKQVEQFSFTI